MAIFNSYVKLPEGSDHCSRWGFPKIEVLSKSSQFFWDFPFLASSGVTPMTSMTFPLIYLHCQPFSSNSHRSCLKCGITRKSSKPLSTILVLIPMFLYWIQHFKNPPYGYESKHVHLHPAFGGFGRFHPHQFPELLGLEL